VPDDNGNCQRKTMYHKACGDNVSFRERDDLITVDLQDLQDLQVRRKVAELWINAEGRRVGQKAGENVRWWPKVW
jgi:hypothetical protein